MDTSVGVIGLGNMGSAYAANLLHDEFTVVGFDTDERRRRELADLGGRPVGSAGEVGDCADLVITSLPGEDALLDTVGELARGTDVLVADTSTLALAAKERARQRLGHDGHVLLDCPVSGTGSQARSGDIVVYASGDRRAYERLGPVLTGFARTHRYVGDFGAGTKLKFVANLLVSVHNVAAAEALVLARKAGLDPDAALDALTEGAGTSRMLEVRGPTMLAESWHEPSADLSIYRKDLALIREFAASLDCPVPLLASAAQVYAAALAQGRDHEDAAAVFAVLAESARLTS